MVVSMIVRAAIPPKRFAGGLLIQTPRVQNPTQEHFLKFELTRSIRDQERLGAGVVAIGISGD